jgi:hypothetical protein
MFQLYNEIDAAGVSVLQHTAIFDSEAIEELRCWNFRLGTAARLT